MELSAFDIKSTGKVSVVVPVYNGDRHLQLALRSIINQSYRDTETVIIDDASVDRTAEVVAAVKVESPEAVLRYVRHRGNRGLAAARNTGLSLATGQWIAFLDHDDVWQSWHLEELLNEMQRKKADLGCAAADFFEDATGRLIRVSRPSATEMQTPVESLFSRNFAIVSATVIRSSVAKRVGEFRPQPKGCEDYDYWLRAARIGATICCRGKSSVRYRVSEKQMSAGRQYMLEGESTAIRMNIWGYPSPLAGRLIRASTVFQELGFVYYGKRPGLAAAAFLRSWAYWPVALSRMWMGLKSAWRWAAGSGASVGSPASGVKG